MGVIYSDHASKRMKQRGVTRLQVEHVLEHPSFVKKTIEGKRIAVGTVEGRLLKVVHMVIEKDIKIVTVI